jgi:hypothetical protein
MKKYYRFLIYLVLIGFASLGFYLFYTNTKLLTDYDLSKTKSVTGRLETYTIGKKRRGVYFSFKLSNQPTLFVLPSPEWKAFDFENFRSLIAYNNLLTVTFPQKEENKYKTTVFQIQIDRKKLIDFDKQKQARKREMYLSLLVSVSCTIALLFHVKKPWI